MCYTVASYQENTFTVTADYEIDYNSVKEIISS